MIQSIPDLVQGTVVDIDPEATVILFGSRARGDFRPDSDWDFLILSALGKNWSSSTEIRHKIYDLELVTGESIQCIITDHEKWELMTGWPVHNQIQQDGQEINSLKVAS